MTLSKALTPPSSPLKEAPKKGLPLSCKYTRAAACAREARGDVGIQSTDQRRKYMRRGSKTPTMLLFDCLDWNFLSSDISQTHDTTVDPTSRCPPDVRLGAAMKALTAASNCLSENDLELFRAQQQHVEMYGAAPRMLHTATPFEVAPLSARKTTPSTSHVELRHMSLMLALKQQMETTSISSASHPLRRRMSLDLVL